MSEKTFDPSQRWPQRMWINQPSMLQPMHDRHGMLVLAVHEYDDTYRVYPVAGETVSFQAKKLWLSDGWPLHLRRHEIPPEVAGTARKMRANGYRGPLAWAKTVIDYVAAQPLAGDANG